MAKLNWAAARAEDLGRRRGYEQMETGPLCGPPHAKQDRKKVKYPRPPKPPKKRKVRIEISPKTPLRPPFHAAPPPANVRSYDGR